MEVDVEVEELVDVVVAPATLVSAKVATIMPQFWFVGVTVIVAL